MSFEAFEYVVTNLLLVGSWCGINGSLGTGAAWSSTSGLYKLALVILDSMESVY